MRPYGKATWLIAVVASGFVSIALAAEHVVAGWNTDDDPFSNDPAAASNSIVASAVIDPQLGVRANLKARCDRGQVEFTVGIANGSIEPLSGNISKIEVRLDNYNPELIGISLTGNANRFSFPSYKSSYFEAGTYFLIGLPMNGAKEILRIALKESKVAAFLTECTAVQQAVEKKAAEEEAARQVARQAEKADRLQKLRKLNLKGGEIFVYNNDHLIFLPMSSTMTKSDHGYNVFPKCVATILSVHTDSDGIDDFYSITLKCPTSMFGSVDAKGWVDAQLFNEQRPSTKQISKTAVEDQQRQQAEEAEFSRKQLLCRGQWAALDQVRRSCMKQAMGAHNVQWFNDCVTANAQLDGVCKDTPLYPH
jgi:hypothetical protein